jgi:hypothetical protein
MVQAVWTAFLKGTSSTILQAPSGVTMDGNSRCARKFPIFPEVFYGIKDRARQTMPADFLPVVFWADAHEQLYQQ